MPQAATEQIAHYLRTGEYDECFRGWAGENFSACAQQAQAALRDALIAKVLSRTTHALEPPGLADLDVVTFTRAKVAPMVHGLFPSSEQDIVLDVLGRSVVFLTPTGISTVLAKAQSLRP